ncbi:MAG TPA: hypothetical protein VLA04_01125, partial [Verrucomicrobiae bacterium]|nr:hypothetical protein [Verrucomicrobiae bacterium]
MNREERARLQPDLEKLADRPHHSAARARKAFLQLLLKQEGQDRVRDEMNAQALEITAQATQTCIGMFTSADRNSQFVGEVWTRDAALACAVFGRFDPQMAVETFTTILSHAQPSGRLPLRVEYVRHWANYVPPLRWLKRMGIDLITRPEAHAVYNNVRFSIPARDSASALIVSCGELFDHSAEVRKFVEDNWTFLLRSL